MRYIALPALLLVILAQPAQSQHPFGHYTEAVSARFSPGHPVVHYTLRVNPADLSGWTVRMEVRNAPDTFQVAMAAHPEYDDRYYRYLRELVVSSGSPGASVTRVDSAVWRVVAPGGAATLSYRVALPQPEAPPRAAWRPFLAPEGGLTGGPHAFLYVLGGELGPSHVRLELPDGWSVATGLEQTTDPAVFFAPTVHALVEAPIFAGRFSDWSFAVDGVPHRVVYWTAPGGVSFDSVRFVGDLERLVRASLGLFGRAPYRDYTFIFQDDAYGGLEHPNSVTLGAPSRDLARDPAAVLGEVAHEYFHTWNLMRIRPAEYRDVTFHTQSPTAGLWFSEGLTIFYADLLRRRAGLPVEDSSRVSHLEQLLSRYLANPGNHVFAAESISRVEYNAGPGALGDYTASSHLVGEVLGTMLDLAIRGATGNARSMDDVMRLMLERHGGPRGFTGADIERAVEDVCGCDVSPLFDRQVRGGGAPVDFNRYLALAGWRAEVDSVPATWNGEPERDLRIYAWLPPGESELRLIITNPGSAWSRAGLHSGDQLVSVNGEPVRTWPAFRSILARSRMGDTLAFEVRRPAGIHRATVRMAGFSRPVVTIRNAGEVSAEERQVRAAWLDP